MKSLKSLKLAAAFALAAAAAGAQQPNTAGGGPVVYVVPTTAEIRSGDKLGGPVVATVAKGEQLVLLQETPLRWRVRTSRGVEGWITARQASKTAPDTGRGLGGLVRDDRQVAEMRTTATNRGLVSSEAKKMAEQEGISEEAIAQVNAADTLAASIKDADVDAFATEGGLVK